MAGSMGEMAGSERFNLPGLEAGFPRDSYDPAGKANTYDGPWPVTCEVTSVAACEQR
jgi:hypothetical protein